MLMIFFNNFNT